MPRRAKQLIFTTNTKPDYNLAAALLATSFHQALVAKNQTLKQEALCEQQLLTRVQVKTDMMYQ